MVAGTPRPRGRRRSRLEGDRRSGVGRQPVGDQRRLERDHRLRAQERVLDLGGDRAAGPKAGGSPADATLAGVSASPAAPVHCANHPRVETALAARIAASRSAPTAWCRRRSGSSAGCAAQPRSARVTLRPDRAARRLAAAFGVGTAAGVVLAYAGYRGLRVLHAHRRLRGRPTGGAGDPAGGRYSTGPSTTGWIAAAGAGWAYVMAAHRDRLPGRRQPAAPTSRGWACWWPASSPYREAA